MSTPEEEFERQKLHARVDELNALALAETLAELRQIYDAKFEALENEIITLKGIVQGMQQTIGNTIAQQWGHGSTIRE